MSKAYILDACAVIALLKGESGAKSVEEILVKSKDSHTVYMSKFNLLIAVALQSNVRLLPRQRARQAPTF